MLIVVSLLSQRMVAFDLYQKPNSRLKLVPRLVSIHAPLWNSEKNHKNNPYFQENKNLKVVHSLTFLMEGWAGKKAKDLKKEASPSLLFLWKRFPSEWWEHGFSRKKQRSRFASGLWFFAICPFKSRSQFSVRYFWGVLAAELILSLCCRSVVSYQNVVFLSWFSYQTVAGKINGMG